MSEELSKAQVETKPVSEFYIYQTDDTYTPFPRIQFESNDNDPEYPLTILTTTLSGAEIGLTLSVNDLRQIAYYAAFRNVL